jgi:hypothetical protein
LPSKKEKRTRTRKRKENENLVGNFLLTVDLAERKEKKRSLQPTARGYCLTHFKLAGLASATKSETVAKLEAMNV